MRFVAWEITLADSVSLRGASKGLDPKPTEDPLGVLPWTSVTVGSDLSHVAMPEQTWTEMSFTRVPRFSWQTRHLTACWTLHQPLLLGSQHYYNWTNRYLASLWHIQRQLCSTQWTTFWYLLEFQHLIRSQVQFRFKGLLTTISGKLYCLGL